MLKCSSNFPLPPASPFDLQPWLISQCLGQYSDTQNHNEQSNSNNNQQRKTKPAEHHRGTSNSGFDTTIAQILGYYGCGNGSRMLP
jgi:hypothetical protein